MFQVNLKWHDRSARSQFLVIHHLNVHKGNRKFASTPVRTSTDLHVVKQAEGRKLFFNEIVIDILVFLRRWMNRARQVVHSLFRSAVA